MTLSETIRLVSSLRWRTRVGCLTASRFAEHPVGEPPGQPRLVSHRMPGLGWPRRARRTLEGLHRVVRWPIERVACALPALRSGAEQRPGRPVQPELCQQDRDVDAQGGNGIEDRPSTEEGGDAEDRDRRGGDGELAPHLARDQDAHERESCADEAEKGQEPEGTCDGSGCGRREGGKKPCPRAPPPASVVSRPGPDPEVRREWSNMSDSVQKKHSGNDELDDLVGHGLFPSWSRWGGIGGLNAQRPRDEP